MVIAHQREREAVPFARRPDARIWWDQSGTGDPVLLIMGRAYGAGMWHRAVPELAACYRVIRFDNRGVGCSSDPPGPYSVQLMAEDALAVLDAASAASAHVYGVSLSGAIALQLALDHPGRVRSLILGCTAASAEGVPRGVLVTRVRSLLPAAALNRMAWKLLYGPGTPAGRRAEDQQIVRRTRCSGRGRRGQLTGAARAANQQVLRFLAGIPGPAGGSGTSRGRRLQRSLSARARCGPARCPGPRRSDIHQRKTRRTARRGNPAGSRLNDLDLQVLAIAPAWMADEEAPASG